MLAGFHADVPDEGVPELVHIGEQWAPGSFLIGDHTHAVWEFYLQIDGVSQWDAPGASGEQTYTLRDGSFFAVAPNVLHRMHEYSKARHHFFFAAVDLNAVWRRYPLLAPLWENRMVVFFEAAQDLMSPFRRLIREVSIHLPQRTTGICLALDYLVLEASRLLQHSPSPSLVAGHAAVARARELLDHQPTRPWTLAGLARMAGLSPSHLAECFTREVGVPPHHYLLQNRIEHARQLLQCSDVPITQLALELGFSSSQHFAGAFKKVTGTTARDYRANSRRGGNS